MFRWKYNGENNLILGRETFKINLDSRQNISSRRRQTLILKTWKRLN